MQEIVTTDAVVKFYINGSTYQLPVRWLEKILKEKMESSPYSIDLKTGKENKK